MLKILIVDDFEPFRASALRVIDRLGHEVLAASGGREGWDLFVREQPAIVITDLTMPEMDGEALLSAIKARSPQTEVVVLTGFSTEVGESDLVRQGAFACLKKPLQLQALVDVIERIQQKRAALSRDVRPMALLKVESPPCRDVLERALRANECDVAVPGSAAQWRERLDRGELDILVWEVHAGETESLKRVMETRELRSGFEVILLLTESGPAELTARDILRIAPSECLSAPLDDGLVAAAYRRALHRLLIRRNAHYKRERFSQGSWRIGMGPSGEVEVDARGGGPELSRALDEAAGRVPWPWLLVTQDGRVVYTSPAAAGWLGTTPARVDRNLWDLAEKQGVVLPPLEDFFPALARCARGETMPGPSRMDALGLFPVNILSEGGGSERYVALFFPSSPPAPGSTP